MKRDYRIEAPKITPTEWLRDTATTTVVSLKGLWPSREDYRELPRSWGHDLMAGLTVGIVALPLALGFGVASGAGAAAGLVTAIIAGVVAAVFGGSHLQVSGPTGAMTVVLLPVIAQYGLASVPLLAIMAGAFVIAMALTRLGRAVDTIPYPVVEGFTMGIGVIILLQQLPLLLGTPKPESESTLVTAWLTLAETDWSRAAAPLTVAALVVVLHLATRFVSARVPVSLLAIIVATIAARAAGLGVEEIGVLPAGLPAPSMPAFTPSLLVQLAPPALAVAALAALESLLSARVADGMAPDVERTQPDRELMGQGLANVAVGLFGGMPATGAIARTAVNVRSGARTRVAAITHVLVLVVVVYLLGPIVAQIPLAALGGVLVVTAVRMISLRHARTIMRTTRADRSTFLLTLGATILLDLVMAVLAGMLMAGVMSIRHMASYSVVRRQWLPADTREGVIDFTPEQEHLRHRVAMFRVDGALFYGDARRFADQVLAVKGVDAVIIRCHRMHVFDASGAEALKEVVTQLSARGVPVVVQGMTNTQVNIALTVHAITPDRMVTELSQAVALVDEILGPPAPNGSASGGDDDRRGA